MIMDIHSHTFYSNCGRDDPHLTIQAAIDGGIELFGITDHNYGIGDRKKEYFDLLTALQSEYAGKIRIVRGIELATVSNLWLRDEEDISYFDYCLVEHLDSPESSVGMNIFDYAKRLDCGRVGIAHTDLISFARRRGEDPVDFLAEFAKNGIFWEMNVNYDSIHRYREHPYVLRLYESEEEQEIVRRSGIELAVGFDGHRVEDYCPERVQRMCRFLEEKQLPMVQL